MKQMKTMKDLNKVRAKALKTQSTRERAQDSTTVTMEPTEVAASNSFLTKGTRLIEQLTRRKSKVSTKLKLKKVVKTARPHM
jgi:hypothetical protein